MHGACRSCFSLCKANSFNVGTVPSGQKCCLQGEKGPLSVWPTSLPGANYVHFSERSSFLEQKTYEWHTINTSITTSAQIHYKGFGILLSSKYTDLLFFFYFMFFVEMFLASNSLSQNFNGASMPSFLTDIYSHQITHFYDFTNNSLSYTGIQTFWSPTVSYIFFTVWSGLLPQTKQNYREEQLYKETENLLTAYVQMLIQEKWRKNLLSIQIENS